MSKSKTVNSSELKMLRREIGKLSAVRREERRHFEYYAAGSCSSTATVDVLNEIAQGDNFNNRAGDYVRMNYLHVNLAAELPTGSDTTNRVRFLIVMDRRSSGGVMTDTSLVLQDQTTSGRQITSPYFWENKERFKILLDESMYLSLNGDGCQGLVRRIPLDVNASYSGTTATLPTMNAIYMFTFSDSIVANHPNISFFTQLVYDA